MGAKPGTAGPREENLSNHVLRLSSRGGAAGMPNMAAVNLNLRDFIG